MGGAWHTDVKNIKNKLKKIYNFGRGWGPHQNFPNNLKNRSMKLSKPLKTDPWIYPNT